MSWNHRRKHLLFSLTSPRYTSVRVTGQTQKNPTKNKEQQRKNTKVSNYFDVLLTVHLSIILVIDQLNIQILVL